LEDAFVTTGATRAKQNIIENDLPRSVEKENLTPKLLVSPTLVEPLKEKNNEPQLVNIQSEGLNEEEELNYDPDPIVIESLIQH